MYNRRVTWNKSSDALEWLLTMTLVFNTPPQLRSSNSSPVVLLLSLGVKYRHYEVHLRERDCEWVYSGQGNGLYFLFSWGFFLLRSCFSPQIHVQFSQPVLPTLFCHCFVPCFCTAFGLNQTQTLQIWDRGLIPLPVEKQRKLAHFPLSFHYQKLSEDHNHLPTLPHQKTLPKRFTR